jgi:hypothetical protein
VEEVSSKAGVKDEEQQVKDEADEDAIMTGCTKGVVAWPFCAH